jgi:hypothetical protein
LTIGAEVLNQSPPTPAEARERLRFISWNVQSCAHFDANQISLDRWPSSQAEADEKIARVSAALQRCIEFAGGVELIALCEITSAAAQTVRDRVLPGYRVYSLDYSPLLEPDFHVAFIYTPDDRFIERPPLAFDQVPATTRGAGILDLLHAEHTIRFLLQHWTWAANEQGHIYQSRIADQVQANVYEFVRGTETRHAVLLGDFNFEPFDSVSGHLGAGRSRAKARVQHHTDAATNRVRFYNAGWRLLGERMTEADMIVRRDIAGSHFHPEHGWRTVDSVVVTGGLAGIDPPRLLESTLTVYSDDELLADDGTPRKFRWNNGAPAGVSDHLPIVGSIELT